MNFSNSLRASGRTGPFSFQVQHQIAARMRHEARLGIEPPGTGIAGGDMKANRRTAFRLRGFDHLSDQQRGNAATAEVRSHEQVGDLTPAVIAQYCDPADDVAFNDRHDHLDRAMAGLQHPLTSGELLQRQSVGCGRRTQAYVCRSRRNR